MIEGSAYYRVPRIFPLGDCSYRKTVRHLGREILEAMDGHIDHAREERLLNFLRKQTLAAGLRQRSRLKMISGCLNNLNAGLNAKTAKLSGNEPRLP